MAAQAQSPEQAELTQLREKVALLEKQVAERNRLERSLADGRQLFDAFMSRMPVPAWMKDDSGRYRYANRAFLNLIGEFQASVLGASDYDLWPAEVADAVRERDQNTLGSAAPQHCLETYPFPQGDRRFHIIRFPFETRSRARYCGGIGVEITERERLDEALRQARAAEETARAQAVSMLVSLRSTEARGRRLFESPVAGVMLCDGDLILDANETLLSWLGISRAELNDAPWEWRKITPSRYRGFDDRALEQLRATGSFPPYEKEFHTRSGLTIPVIVGGGAAGEPGGEYFCFVLNIGERKQMEERLLRSQKLESLGLISSGVAHDFNNLLATILGNSSLATDAISREHPAFRPLCEVQIASRRASELTQQMLAYAGRAAFAIRPVDLSTAVREIGSLLETTISKKVTLKLDLTPELPYIDGDEGQIQQIIMNLVINASEAIGENPGEIRVSTRALHRFENDGFENSQGAAKPGRYVAFEVSDSGCGMSEETKLRIFDPFFTTKKNGRGIGLATVLGIVRNHHGALLVDSHLGHGTTFRVVFPAGESQPAARPRTVAAAREQLWGNETILVADDDEGIRRMNRAALERFGYKVLLAADGDEAVRLYRQHKGEIAVVLLDWAMPVMNGDEALARIIEIDPTARVLMSSGYAETGTLKRDGKPLIAGFVQKPYTTTQIVERLRGVISEKPEKKGAGVSPMGSANGLSSRSADS